MIFVLLLSLLLIGGGTLIGQKTYLKKIQGLKAEKKIDVRFIFATNKKLYEEVQQKKFREDFYYRIKGAEVDIPPLRAAKDDIEIMQTSLEAENIETVWVGDNLTTNINCDLKIADKDSNEKVVSKIYELLEEKKIV